MKHGIVTGSSRGIGLATVEMLYNGSGFKIIDLFTTGNNPLGHSNFKCLKLDLSNSNSIEKFVAMLKDIKLDFIINNAGILIEKWDVSAINMKQLKQTFNTNVFGIIELTEKLLSRLNTKAYIISIASDWGLLVNRILMPFRPIIKCLKQL
ncbi:MULTISPECIES: SDR family NAD(P)-dependent oxidoreductase [Flavobacteriaceae]|uniref:SDR family NAD(P)-dependent oxidoreductase n=1 Tax=Flavobacteriaceae TaxID=49546 RepID=UPI0038B4F9EA